jgi:hypothetical protein
MPHLAILLFGYQNHVRSIAVFGFVRGRARSGQAMASGGAVNAACVERTLNSLSGYCILRIHELAFPWVKGSDGLFIANGNSLRKNWP